jgi:fimbrial chaperone protein
MRAAASLLGVLAATGTAVAGSLGVSPIRVELSPAARTAIITIRNEETASVVVQARPVAWSQSEEHDQLDDTRDLLVTPPLFTLPAKGHQIVRIALLRTPDPARELDYRIVLSEVPPAADAETPGLRFALRITLPVFVAAQVHASPNLAWQHDWLPDGTLQVQARNRGTAHIQILDFDALTADQPALSAHTDSARYLLPGTLAYWRLRAGSAVSHDPRLFIHGHSDAGDFSLTSATGAP